VIATYFRTPDSQFKTTVAGGELASLTLQIAVNRVIDLAHAAGADLGGDLVNAESRARSEGRVVGAC
jgi:hypothetical protein